MLRNRSDDINIEVTVAWGLKVEVSASAQVNGKLKMPVWRIPIPALRESKRIIVPVSGIPVPVLIGIMAPFLIEFETTGSIGATAKGTFDFARELKLTTTGSLLDGTFDPGLQLLGEPALWDAQGNIPFNEGLLDGSEVKVEAFFGLGPSFFVGFAEEAAFYVDTRVGVFIKGSGKPDVNQFAPIPVNSGPPVVKQGQCEVPHNVQLIASTGLKVPTLRYKFDLPFVGRPFVGELPISFEILMIRLFIMCWVMPSDPPTEPPTYMPVPRPQIVDDDEPPVIDDQVMDGECCSYSLASKTTEKNSAD